MNIIDKIWAAFGYRTPLTPQELLSLAEIRKRYDDALTLKNNFHVREGILREYGGMVEGLHKQGKEVSQERVWHHRTMSGFSAEKQSSRGYR